MKDPLFSEGWFLESLTDEGFLKDPAFASPFVEAAAGSVTGSAATP